MDYIFLAFMMFCAGFIDSLAGGGGIITLPSYMAFGLNPALLLGTNKLSSCIGTLFSAYKLRDNITISKKFLKRLIIITFIFSSLGAAFTKLINPDSLKFIILIIIPITAWFVISNKTLGIVDLRMKITIKKSNRAAKISSAIIAWYDGFLGPGAGTMFAVFLSKYSGFDIVQATALAKILNLSSNVFALAFFLVTDSISLKLGLLMGVFNILGNVLGVHVGKKRGAAIIRPMIIFVSIMIMGKFIWDFTR